MNKQAELQGASERQEDLVPLPPLPPEHRAKLLALAERGNPRSRASQRLRELAGA